MTRRCVHALLMERIASYGDRTAIVLGERRVSYAELDRWTNRIARKLQERGIGADDVVAICTGRTPEMVASVLAVHKAGAAYVPIDPALPAERLAFMVTDAQSRLVIAQRDVWMQPESVATPVASIDELSAGGSDDPVASDVTPDHLAYVIYTSGSTGRPKGIEMPHAVLANLLEWQHAHYTWRADARWGQYSAFFFDASFVEIYATLIAGGTLHLISEELRTDFHALCRLLHDERIERTYIPMVALGQIAEAVRRPGTPCPDSLREVIVSGEQLKISDAVRELFQRLGPDAVLHNQYGPAESHVVTAHALRAPSSAWPALPSIGTPIWQTRLYLLDESLAPVPDGTPGELFIGETIARGYRGRPDVTAERFVPDPFATTPGALMYRTGDVAVRERDGTYTFHGRADFQLKIRGYRVEPLEIELALARHAGVAQAAVTAFEDRSGQNSLAAYVVRRGDEIEVPALRAFLDGVLPCYMVPAVFVFVDALPMTPSGKLDRLALPKPLLQRHEPARLSDGHDPIDAVLVALWCETFGLATIDVHDDFFDLGGHSLMSIELLARTHDVFGVEYPMLALFEAPTIAAMREALPGFAADPDRLDELARSWLATRRQLDS